MENIIEKLYELHIKTAQYPFGVPDKNTTTQEWTLYFSLIEDLPKKQKENFVEYASICQERHKQEIKAVYEHGFKTAVKLLLECNKE